MTDIIEHEGVKYRRAANQEPHNGAKVQSHRNGEVSEVVDVLPEYVMTDRGVGMSHGKYTVLEPAGDAPEMPPDDGAPDIEAILANLAHRVSRLEDLTVTTDLPANQFTLAHSIINNASLPLDAKLKLIGAISTLRGGNE